MKSVFSIFSCILVTISLYACSTPTTSVVTDDEEIYNSTENKFSSSYQSDEKQSSSSAISSSSSETAPKSSSTKNTANIYDAVQETGKYTNKDSVAAYVCKFDKLPQNYVGKSEGQKLYESSTGNAFSKWNFNPWKTLGVMIGGDTFENREGLLPTGSYREADVDYGNATSRGTKRLVYQSGCIIYYTADHYESFSRINF